MNVIYLVVGLLAVFALDFPEIAKQKKKHETVFFIVLFLIVTAMAVMTAVIP